MCGVAAQFIADAHSQPDVVDRLLVFLAPRGPDSSGKAATVLSRGSRVVLGHRRLAIIDTSEAGHQPMRRRNVTVTFNGEIYNYLELRMELENFGHTFRTRSDTEVLLAAYEQWGLNAFCKVRGMFAIVFVDALRREMVIARDRFGVKPLYWTRQAQGVVVASTADSLAAALGRQPSMGYVARGLRTWSYESSDDSSAFEDVYAVPAGHFAVVRLEPNPVVEFERWYDLRQAIETAGREYPSVSDESDAALLGDLLADATSLRMRSDVPVACALSGGLDSAYVAALAGRDVAAICFGSPSWPTSEGPLAAKTAKALGVPIRFVAPTPLEIAGALRDTITAQGSPFMGPAVVAQYLVAREARALGYPVLLGGQGADEALLGYRKFLVGRASDLLRGGRPAAALSASVFAFATILAERGRWQSYYLAARRYWGPSRTTSDASVRFPEVAVDPLVRPRDEDCIEWAIQDVLARSLPTLLRYEDRNSMANGVESRLPFLDHKVVEFALSRPPERLIHRGRGKWPLRVASRGLLPSALYNARGKRGFETAASSWMSGGMGITLRELAADALPAARAAGFVDRLDVGTYFSDARLAKFPLAFGEAVSLAWWSDWVDASPRK